MPELVAYADGTDGVYSAVSQQTVPTTAIWQGSDMIRHQERWQHISLQTASREPGTQASPPSTVGCYLPGTRCAHGGRASCWRCWLWVGLGDGPGVTSWISVRER